MTAEGKISAVFCLYNKSPTESGLLVVLYVAKSLLNNQDVLKTKILADNVSTRISWSCLADLNRRPLPYQI
jgi:hypothetical protein